MHIREEKCSKKNCNVKPSKEELAQHDQRNTRRPNTGETQISTDTEKMARM